MSTTTLITKLQSYSETAITKIKNCPQYQRVQALPALQRNLTWVGLFLISQIVIFGALYLLFG